MTAWFQASGDNVLNKKWILALLFFVAGPTILSPVTVLPVSVPGARMEVAARCCR